MKHLAKVYGYKTENGQLSSLECELRTKLEGTDTPVCGPLFSITNGLSPEDRDRLLNDSCNINSYFVLFTCSGFRANGTPQRPILCSYWREDDLPARTASQGSTMKR